MYVEKPQALTWRQLESRCDNRASRKTGGTTECHRNVSYRITTSQGSFSFARALTGRISSFARGAWANK
jgi:hypothetical protein